MLSYLTEMLAGPRSQHPVWSIIVDALGVGYFLAWSISFYPQVILNYQRQRTDGLSSDFVYLNPLGFIALTVFNWGMTFSPLARSQYADRHHGHTPEVAPADLAFSLHAAIISTITLGQVWWYRRRTIRKEPKWMTSSPSERSGEAGEHDRLIPTPADIARYNSTSNPEGVAGATIEDPAIPSVPCQFALAGIFLAAAISGFFVWTERTNFLDWLYLVSSIKLFVSMVKYVPQVVLNWRRKSVEGLAIGQIILDVVGAVLSFAQLVISSVFISGDPGGIVANPAKLGLSGLSISFDIIILSQKYLIYPVTTRHRSGDEDTRDDSEGNG